METGLLIGGDEPAVGGANDVAGPKRGIYVVRLVGGQVVQGDRVAITLVGGVDKVRALVW